VSADVFDRIYRTNAWRGRQSRSGPGSDAAATSQVARDIVELVTDLGVKTVLDVGCGDGYWMPELPGYMGIDVSREAIATSRRLHPDRIYIVCAVGDVRVRDLAPFDLVISRDAMQHLPLDEGLKLLDGILATRSSWLLASTFVDGANIDVVAGEAYRPNLAIRPFGLGDPERTIIDGYSYDPGVTNLRDPGKVLGLWRLAT
jgi:SAM-dependent methyltransferase